MDSTVKQFLAQLFAEGPVKHAFARILSELKDENLERMRSAVRANDARVPFACLEIERTLDELPANIQRILESL